jgi:tetratricopeptide (TPR) repeat protein
VHHGLGDRQRALEYYGQALPIAREVGDRAGEAAALNNIGLAYDGLGERRRALEFYGQALPIRREVAVKSRRGPFDISPVLLNLGKVRERKG